MRGQGVQLPPNFLALLTVSMNDFMSLLTHFEEASYAPAAAVNLVAI